MDNELTERLDETWRPLRAKLDEVRGRLDELTPAGWTAKEMLGHLAFWLECTEPVVIGMLRGDVERMMGWRFPSGFAPDPNADWPHFEVHNAREAAWAREQDVDTVFKRLDGAYASARAALGSFTEEELADERFQNYAREQIDHVAEHTPEVEALAPDRG